MHYNKFRQIKALMDRCDAEREGRSGAAAPPATSGSD